MVLDNCWVFHCIILASACIFKLSSFPNADQLILPVIMILTGLSFITLFSLQDPLKRSFSFKKHSVLFWRWIFLVSFVMMLFNLRYFTTDSFLYRLFIFKGVRKAANGWPWAIMAIGLVSTHSCFWYRS